MNSISFLLLGGRRVFSWFHKTNWIIPIHFLDAIGIVIVIIHKQHQQQQHQQPILNGNSKQTRLDSIKEHRQQQQQDNEECLLQKCVSSLFYFFGFLGSLCVCVCVHKLIILAYLSIAQNKREEGVDGRQFVCHKLLLLILISWFHQCDLCNILLSLSLSLLLAARTRLVLFIWATCMDEDEGETIILYSLPLCLSVFKRCD